MPKTGENIYKRKDGRWEGRYIRYYDENGVGKYGYVYAKTYREVKIKLAEKSAIISSRQILLSNSHVTYDEILTAWLQSSRINIKESTYARYTHIVDSHIRPSLGKYQLCKISTQLIEGYIESKLHNGRLDKNGPLSAKTVTDMLSIIKSSFEYARYNNLPVICNLSKLSIKRKDKEMRVLRQDEQNLLVRVLLDKIDLYKFGVLLSLYTGIRIGELCALRWGNLCLDDRILRVRETMQRIRDTNMETNTKTKIIITEPKSQCSIRDIPLPECIVVIARQFRASDKDFILTGDRVKFVEPRTMQNRFRHYVMECGIDQANFHSLRHTFATRCVELGFELKSLSEILGHSNVNITLNKYVHSSFELKHSNMNKLTLPL